jgi:hypothetical protein
MTDPTEPSWDVEARSRVTFGIDWTCVAHGDDCPKSGLDWDCATGAGGR